MNCRRMTASVSAPKFAGTANARSAERKSRRDSPSCCFLHVKPELLEGLVDRLRKFSLENREGLSIHVARRLPGLLTVSRR